jgi:hypothetical protein
MFEVYCASHGSRVLLTTSRIEAVRNLDGGDILVEWRCWCGHPGRSLNGETLPETVTLDLIPGCEDPAAWPDAS